MLSELSSTVSYSQDALVPLAWIPPFSSMGKGTVVGREAQSREGRKKKKNIRKERNAMK